MIIFFLTKNCKHKHRKAEKNSLLQEAACNILVELTTIVDISNILQVTFAMIAF